MGRTRSTVLVTGGAGFIGSNFVRQWLAEEADDVVNLDALTYAGLRESLGEALNDPRHELVVGDVGDADLVRRLLQERRPRAIVHLAAESHVDRSIVEPAGFVQANVLGTAVLLEETTRWLRSRPNDEQEGFRFLHVSTDEVFGSAAPSERFTSASPLQPSSPYSASKAGGELLARAFGQTYDLPVVIVNPCNHYGPQQLPEKLVPKMILCADRGEPLPLYGDGLHERDWLHVDDGCRALRLALARGVVGERVLVGGNACWSNRRIVEHICDEVDRYRNDGRHRRELIAATTDRPGHDRRYALDATATQQRLGWAPRTPLEAGLAATVTWYLENPKWVAAAEKSLARQTAEHNGSSCRGAERGPLLTQG
ncbi:MAG: dTDP-glucose 4,6-dehydratase [Pirellulales bacterium]|nr:dTDP-glucose 4,6-dehydratase [Pirellulales bacterium]